MSEARQIYQTEFVKSLFDDMSKTYGIVNTISSFGFCYLWRLQCANQLEFKRDQRVVDLMSGMSELAILIRQKNPQVGHFTCVDLSAEMCNLGRRSVRRKNYDNFSIFEADALSGPLPNESADAVVSTFGLKTFTEQQLRLLSTEIFRILVPGGGISFLEISVPKNKVLRSLYMFYLNRVIPIIGKLFMGSPDNYRLLGVYTSNFQNCDRATEIFREAGFDLTQRSFFFGCATGFFGKKPG